MKSQACTPCAKRKVRCDRGEPCSNCKRRKRDQCIYPDVSSVDRIKQLEALVRKLGGNPESSDEDYPIDEQAETSSVPAHASVRLHRDSREHFPGAGPSLVEEDGETVYLESFARHSWESKHGMPPNRSSSSREKDHFRLSTLASPSSVALESMIYRDPSIDLSSRHPTSQHAAGLWSAFHRNVKPFFKIFFDWELDRLHTAATLHEVKQEFAPWEHAFVFALYLITVVSLSQEECLALFDRPRSSLLTEYQMLCEQALARSSFLGSSEIMVLQALSLYIWANIERISSRSLWSLMGVVLRNAERLGLHRDGTCLGLSPADTERRRRIWWQLQQLDIALGAKCGNMPMMLKADWDAKLPLNIEDDDITPSTKVFPKERRGITSMSYCLWTYWVVSVQRSFRREDGGSVGVSWLTDRSLPRNSKETILERLENGLNNYFFQFCDPIKPLDSVIQLTGRAFICGMRRMSMQTLAQNTEAPNRPEKLEKEFLDVCMKCLEYDIAMNSNRAIRHFMWRANGFFQWSALVYVVVEARRHADTPKAKEIWDLISDLYAAIPKLMNFSEDRRRPHIAELIVAAWSAREASLLERPQQNAHLQQKPAFVADLEAKLWSNDNCGQQPSSYEPQETAAVGNGASVPTSYDFYGQPEMTNVDFFEMMLTDDPLLPNVDWSFWESLD